MTQEDKELLLKDLCARLPYRVKIHYHYSNSLGSILDEDRELDFSDVETLKYNIENKQDNWCDFSLKPYFRPLDSMTDEEKEKYNKLFTILTSKDCNFGKWLSSENDSKLIDFYNSHHFDYRGLIPMGLALEAPDGMYK